MKFEKVPNKALTGLSQMVSKEILADWPIHRSPALSPGLEALEIIRWRGRCAPRLADAARGLDAGQAAELAARACATVLLGDAATLRTTARYQLRNGRWRVSFEQVVGDYPVFGARLSAVATDGNILDINGNLSPIVTNSTAVPKLSARDAWNEGWKNLRHGAAPDSLPNAPLTRPQLFWFASKGDAVLRLVWYVALDDQRTPPTVSLIDASSGAVVVSYPTTIPHEQKESE